MKKHLILLIILSFLAGCGSGGGGSSPAGGDNNSGGSGDGGISPTGEDSNSGGIGGSKVALSCTSTGKIAKIKVSKDGIYRVTYSDLYSQCSSVLFSPSTISLSNQGDDIPIDFVDSNSNGVFDHGDFIEFYGKAIGLDDSRFRFTETNVYWLSVGEKPGKRMTKLTPSAGQDSSLKLSYQRRLHMEKDTRYVQENYPEISSSSDTREHWFWGDRVYPEIPNDDTDDRITHSFSTRYIDRTVSVSLRIRLQSVSFDHYIKVYVNNNPDPVGEQVWDSQDPYYMEISGIPATLFYSSGLNTLTIESVGGGLFYLDWFEVVYNREYKAEYNVIEFTGNNNITLSSFSTNDISVYEISDPKNVQKILISEPKKISEGDYEVSFSGPDDNNRLFLAVSSDPLGQKRMSPVVEPYTPSFISSNSADYIIITHADFADAIKPLADFREQGHTVLTVKVSDIYDEFGDGIETPHAIKAFLKHAYEKWSTRPKYVLLVGDATVDYKDLSGNSKYGVKSYVPAYLYNYPGFGEVPSDNWFADVDASNGVLPEMAIGRIPAKTNGDVTAVVKKIVSHESSSLTSNNILLISDVMKDPDTEQVYELLSDSIAGLIPSDYVSQKIYRRTYTGDLKDGIISAINSGDLIINYTGHGTVTDWTNDYIFTSGDVSGLNNNKYPFLVALNCMNGYFTNGNEGGQAEKDVDGDGDVDNYDIQHPSIAESFLVADNKGALAVWASSTLGYPSEHELLASALYTLIFNEDNVVLGDVVTEAKKRASTDNYIPDDAIQTFIFFGDPATKLK